MPIYVEIQPRWFRHLDPHTQIQDILEGSWMNVLHRYMSSSKWANGKRTLGTVLVFAATCFDSPTITSRMSRIPLQIFHTATCVAIIFAKAWVTKIFSSSNFAFTAEFPYPTSRAQTLDQISRMAKKKCHSNLCHFTYSLNFGKEMNTIFATERSELSTGIAI